LRVVDVHRDRGLVTLTFDRPERKNALNRQSWDELDEALTEIAANPEDRALMLTGAGGNFSSGADLSGDGSGKMTLPIVVEMRTVGDIILRLHRLPIPTLAKIDGVAVGVGLGLALGCDLVLASDRARLIEIFPKRGLALDGGNSWLLPRLVGLQKAKELAFFGDTLSAEDAAAMGLVNRVVPADELDEVAETWARRLADGPTIALSLSKRMLNNSLAVTMDQALEDEARAQHVCYTTQDMVEAMTAYFEKRDPTFHGR
jgi:2-(1,2-epoxy-1,2-dihydrophenyl)acetyl-CoA isomerase